MLQIERLNESNVTGAAELEKSNFSNPWSVEALSAEINNPDALYLVVKDLSETGEESVIAMAGLIISYDTADVANVSVSEKYRRQNIAYDLLTKLMDEGRQIGVKDFTLEVRENNAPARNLYEKLGFKYEGTRPNFYTNPNEGAAIYWLRTKEV